MSCDVSRRLHESTRPPVTLHQVAHGACGDEIVAMVWSHPTSALRAHKAFGPEAQAREAVPLGRCWNAAQHAVLPHQTSRLALLEDEWQVLIGCDSLIATHTRYLRQYACMTCDAAARRIPLHVHHSSALGAQQQLLFS
eukprot:scaffold126975_cov40-Tisochrysis_lutea.AAC.3